MNVISQKIQSDDIREVSEFFAQESSKLAHKFSYSEGEWRRWADWHSVKELTEKILDPERYFHIIRSENGEIIGFFESKTHSSEPTTQVIQWTLIHHIARREGLASYFYEEFEKYCHEKWMQKIVTFIHEDNIASRKFREKFGFTMRKEDENSNILIYEKFL